MLSIGGTSRTSAILLAVDRTDGVPAFWQVVLEYPCGSPSNSRLPSPPAFALVAQYSRLCSRWFLTHWRYPQRSRPVVSPAVALFNSALLADGLPPKILPQGDSSSFRKLCSASQTSSDITPKLPRKHKTRQCPIDALASSRNHRLVIY